MAARPSRQQGYRSGRARWEMVRTAVAVLELYCQGADKLSGSMQAMEVIEGRCCHCSRTLRPHVGRACRRRFCRCHQENSRRKAKTFAEGRSIRLVDTRKLRVLIASNVATPVMPTSEPRPSKRISKPIPPPTCPKCGSPMVQRVAKSGANAGKQFWGEIHWVM